MILSQKTYMKTLATIFISPMTLVKLFNITNLRFLIYKMLASVKGECSVIILMSNKEFFEEIN